MKRFLLAWFLLCVGIYFAHAQVPMTGAGTGTPGIAYTGPGNILSGWKMWYGLRAYNAAYATGSNNAIQVRRASDNTTENIVILTTGALDIATANTFAGTDATCTGTISSTTLACAGASSTPHAGSTLAGAGIIQPSYIVSCGTFTGGAGTCTLNASQTVSVGETITMQYGLYVATLYDQSGGNNCSSAACNATQASAVRQPQLLPNCGNGLSCMSFVASNSQTLNTATITTVAQTYSVSLVGGSVGTSNTFATASSSGNSMAVQWNYGTSGNVALSAGGPFSATAADGVLHAIQGVFAGASSVLNIDGTETTGNPSTGSISGALGIGSYTSGGYDNGYTQEAGFYASGFTSGNRTSLCHNQYTYWATVTSC